MQKHASFPHFATHACLLQLTLSSKGLPSGAHALHHCLHGGMRGLCGQVTAYGAIKQDGSNSAQLPPNVQFFPPGSSPAPSSSPPVRTMSMFWLHADPEQDYA